MFRSFENAKSNHLVSPNLGLLSSLLLLLLLIIHIMENTLKHCNCFLLQKFIVGLQSLCSKCPIAEKSDLQNVHVIHRFDWNPESNERSK